MRHTVLLAWMLASTPGVLATDTPPAKGESAGEANVPLPSITLVGTDFPEYQEVVGRLSLLGVADPDVLAATDAQYLRLSLVDIERVPYLPEGLVVYQTVSTDPVLPVNLNFVVDAQRRGACFNPEIPYCTDFTPLNAWLKDARLKVEDEATAGKIARFVVGLGLSTVHHPRDFLFFRLTQPFGIEYHHYLSSIEDIYHEGQDPYRSESRRQEYRTITQRYRDVVRPYELKKTESGYRMHAFTYKIMRAAGDLREWTIVVHGDGRVDVDLKTLETGVGELYWSWNP